MAVFCLVLFSFTLLLPAAKGLCKHGVCKETKQPGKPTFVSDNEVPKVLYCPTNIERIARQHSVRVFWQEPVFEDDVDGKAITVTQNSPNGSMFPKGVFVIIYHALDRSGNQATCRFTITIRAPDNVCGVNGTPKNGALVCKVDKTGLTFCGVACQSGFGFAKTNSFSDVYDFYMCSSDGSVYGLNAFRSGLPIGLVKLNPGKAPWPDCSNNNQPGTATKHFATMSGPCTDSKTTVELQTKFSYAINTDPLAKALACSTSSCLPGNLRVKC